MSDWVEFTAEQLHQRSGERPAGYAAEVMDRAHQWGDRWALAPDDFDALRRLYAASAKPASIGLGDCIEWICRATGIKRLVEWNERRTGRHCGCDRRRVGLNRWKIPPWMISPLIDSKPSASRPHPRR